MHCTLVTRFRVRFVSVLIVFEEFGAGGKGIDINLLRFREL